MGRTTRLRELIARERILPAMGAYDALSARLVERAGGEVVYVSGSSVSTSVHGGPDVGLTTMTETVDRAAGIVGATDLPVFCDADTGYGGVHNVARTVASLERVGVAGVHLEDQTFPKQCGHFDGKTVVPTDEMGRRIRSAVRARTDEDFVVVARTDARAVEGIGAAVERGRAYADAGADAVFVEAPESRAELERVADALAGVPLVANVTAGGETPLCTADELDAMGYDVVLFPATGFRAAAKALRECYAHLAEHGTQRGMLDDLLTWAERDEVTGLAAFREAEAELADRDS